MVRVRKHKATSVTHFNAAGVIICLLISYNEVQDLDTCGQNAPLYRIFEFGIWPEPPPQTTQEHLRGAAVPADANTRVSTQLADDDATQGTVSSPVAAARETGRLRV